LHNQILALEWFVHILPEENDKCQGTAPKAARLDSRIGVSPTFWRRDYAPQRHKSSGQTRKPVFLKELKHCSDNRAALGITLA
jgi:hypothetical protein